MAHGVYVVYLLTLSAHQTMSALLGGMIDE
jgi:hypothetical protein